MADSFDEIFDKDIERMKEYLLSDHLKMISFTFTDGWSFRLSIPQKKYQKLLDKRKCNCDLQFYKTHSKTCLARKQQEFTRSNS